MSAFDILAICAFLTLMAVSAATFIAVTGAYHAHRLIRTLEHEVALLPNRIGEAVSQYQKVYREDEDTPGAVVPNVQTDIINTDSEIEAWMQGAGSRYL